MQIVQLEEAADAGRWDAYVAPRTGTVTDLWAWRRILADAYGIRSTFLAATDDARVLGTLGLFEIRHPLFGHYLCTAPFATDGGLWSDDTAARDALLAAARDLADRQGVSYLNIRTRDGDLPGFAVDHHYQTAVLDLTGGADEVWKRRLDNKTRNQVRRGMKEGFTVATGPEQMDAFHDVFHEHMRDLGSPAHSRRFYAAILAHLGDRADFVVVRDGARLAAGALLFRTGGTAMNLHTVALRRYNRRCPNYLIYWRMIEASCGHGCLRFDMGRSEAGSNNLSFKANWGAQALPLAYNYHLRTRKDVPYLDPRNPRYRLPILAWQHLPVGLTRFMGPLLITGLA